MDSWIPWTILGVIVGGFVALLRYTMVHVRQCPYCRGAGCYVCNFSGEVFHR